MTKLEAEFLDRYTSLGFEVLKVGWPDFLINTGDSVFCAEVKSPSDRLTKQQLRMHELLRKAGLKVTVWTSGKTLPAGFVDRPHRPYKPMPMPLVVQPYTGKFDLVRISKAKDQIGVSSEIIRSLERQGKIQVYRRGRIAWFSHSELLQALRSSRHESVPESIPDEGLNGS